MSLEELQKALDNFPVQDTTGNKGTVDVTIWVLQVDDWLETFKELFSAFSALSLKEPALRKEEMNDASQIIQNLIEQTQAENDKILKGIDPPKHVSSETAALNSSYWNNGYIAGLSQARKLFVENSGDFEGLVKKLGAFYEWLDWQELSSKEPSLRKLLANWKANEKSYSMAKEDYGISDLTRSFFDGRIRESEIVRIELEKMLDRLKAEFHSLFPEFFEVIKK